MKYTWLLIFIVFGYNLSQSQQLYPELIPFKISQDSTVKASYYNFIANGYYPTKYFDFDLKYLIKYNQYEGFRTGIGGKTNTNFSNAYIIKGYTVYGFKDKNLKYSISGGFRITPKRNTWIYLTYTDDLEETGSSKFIVDKRLFQLFEPRLLNIDLFHKHITKSISIEHQVLNKVVAETEFAVRKIIPTYEYVYVLPNQNEFTDYTASTLKLSAKWSPFSTFEYSDKGIKETISGFPNFSFQYTQSFKNVFGSDLKFSKLDFRAIQVFEHKNQSESSIILVGGLANGDAPLQYLYHAYPNNVNKETILNRFSVAGTNSFETMYFNEFFSDRFVTVQFKHKLKAFNIAPRFKPQLVFLTKMAVGNMNNIDRHQGIEFKTLENGFFESGIEINKLIFGFGLSFAYRYGPYHLPKLEDNFAFKFTFNLNVRN